MEQVKGHGALTTRNASQLSKSPHRQRKTMTALYRVACERVHIGPFISAVAHLDIENREQRINGDKQRGFGQVPPWADPLSKSK